MAGLGVKVYLDENIHLHLATALNQGGYDAAHALTEGNRKVSDEQHLRFATGQGRAVVTHNFADFVRLHAEFAKRNERHEGIILVPVRTLSELLTRLCNHLDSFAPSQQRDNLFWA
jgi:predicted nuclease of predicted toxin-antitoxin system